MFSTCYWNFFCTSTVTLPDAMCSSLPTRDNTDMPCSLLETLLSPWLWKSYTEVFIFSSYSSLFVFMASSSKPSYFHLFSIPFQKLEFLNLEIKRVNELQRLYYSLNKQASESFRKPGWIYARLCLHVHLCIHWSKGSKTFIRFQKGPWSCRIY